MTNETQTEKKNAEPTNLGAENEAIVTKLRGEVKAPGTNLGRLARRIEIHARAIQDSLEEYAGEVISKTILGHTTVTPIKAEVQLGFALQVGDAPRVTYILELRPNAVPQVTPTLPQPVKESPAAFLVTP